MMAEEQGNEGKNSEAGIEISVGTSNLSFLVCTSQGTDNFSPDREGAAEIHQESLLVFPVPYFLGNTLEL